MWNCSRSFAVKAATPDVVPKQDECGGAKNKQGFDKNWRIR